MNNLYTYLQKSQQLQNLQVHCSEHLFWLSLYYIAKVETQWPNIYF